LLLELQGNQTSNIILTNNLAETFLFLVFIVGSPAQQIRKRSCRRIRHAENVICYIHSPEELWLCFNSASNLASSIITVWNRNY